MLNNQIIITDDTLRAYGRRNEQGIVDAAELTDDAWAELRERNVDSTRKRLVKCGFCWVDHGEVQWMQTFTNHMGNRVIRHQPGESQDHPYQSVETPRHEAYKERAYLFGNSNGLPSKKEAPAEDGSAINDTLLEGVVPLAFEHQHSQFKQDKGLTKRIGIIEAVGRVPMFHTDQASVFNAQKAPILRTDGDVPLEWIRDLNRPLIVTGGLREVIVFTCDARNGVWCPKARISGCGKTHVRTEPLRGTTLDQALMHGAMDEYRYILNAQVVDGPRGFWTTRECYDQYMSALGGDGKLAPLEGAPVEREKTRNGTRRGHSRGHEAELDAMFRQAVVLGRPPVDLSAVAPVRGDPATSMRPTALGVSARPAAGVCSHWIGAERRYCRAEDDIRRYVGGYRCPSHTPSALQGKPEPLPGPGWPIHRR